MFLSIRGYSSALLYVRCLKTIVSYISLRFVPPEVGGVDPDPVYSSRFGSNVERAFGSQGWNSEVSGRRRV